MFLTRPEIDRPSDLCTWCPISECDDCQIAGHLMCRFRQGDLVSFLLGFSPFGISVMAGMIRGGCVRYLVGWLVFWIIFFFVWEARVLCSHCPYWAEEGRILHCHANYGVIKIWKYRPEPMSKSERTQFLIGAAVFIAYPLAFLLLAGEYLLSVVALSAAISFGYSLRRNACCRCVNLSCPLNIVPKGIADVYIRRNPVMRSAWEQSGHRLGSEPTNDGQLDRRNQST